MTRFSAIFFFLFAELSCWARGWKSSAPFQDNTSFWLIVSTKQDSLNVQDHVVTEALVNEIIARELNFSSEADASLESNTLKV